MNLSNATRDAILFFGGLAGVVHETLWPPATGDRPDLLLLYGAMMGLPAFLGWDSRRRRKNGNGNGDGGSSE